MHIYCFAVHLLFICFVRGPPGAGDIPFLFFINSRLMVLGMIIVIMCFTKAKPPSEMLFDVRSNF